LQFHLLVTLIPTPYPKPAVENGFPAVFPSFSFWGLHGTEQSQVQAVPEIYVFMGGRGVTAKGADLLHYLR